MQSTKTLIALAQWQQAILHNKETILRLAHAGRLAIYDDAKDFYFPVLDKGQWELERLEDENLIS